MSMGRMIRSGLCRRLKAVKLVYRAVCSFTVIKLNGAKLVLDYLALYCDVGLEVSVVTLGLATFVNDKNQCHGKNAILHVFTINFLDSLILGLV